ncbi:UBP1-associated protein 2B-like [Asparagus officinalis]|uniref:UBP1-associated protein 2B-like n=1 Tax=Asparagus officinalis TaxID=4686 RepID=UPI00098E18F1|nr:UBP1-associated protein 2B-like [Asparagus officinalis]XP_020255645.1 UBP1-associated protein 2B-like [Asparagus officinalis]XP_020255646.1 UBP1-associated protein 2B-like [Asparagus officinalis]XP_020255647.1 UBP1-associated protein 2B-like [Asparagus officinalis]
MAKGKGAKKRANNRSNKKRNLGLKPHSKPQSQPQNPKQKNQKKPKKPNPIQDENPFTFGSEPESNPSSPTCIQSLLEPYTKPQLISFLLDAAVSDPELRTRIRSIADSDVSHRQLFVFGLGWDATKETLTAAFSPFGPIEDCSVVVDKNTGRAKGYAFVLFKTRSAAIKALKEPQKRIGNKVATCQLSSVGGPKPDGGRKIYVGNVPFDVSVERLREFFARFGVLESGPLGFDGATGKSKGYALFVYKTPEDAKKALEEPYKLFEGRQLYCQLATPKNEMGKVQMAVPAVSPVVPAVAAMIPQLRCRHSSR